MNKVKLGEGKDYGLKAGNSKKSSMQPRLLLISAIERINMKKLSFLNVG